MRPRPAPAPRSLLKKPARKPRKLTAEKKAPRARKTTGVKKAAAPRKTLRKTKVAQQPSSETPAEPKTQKVSIQEVESPVYETPEIKTSVKANSVMTQVSEPTVTLSEPVACIETKQLVDAPAVSAQSERGAVEDADCGDSGACFGAFCDGIVGKAGNQASTV